MAWVKNKRENFENHWFVVDEGGRTIGEEFKSREAAEAECAKINAPQKEEPEPAKKTKKKK